MYVYVFCNMSHTLIHCYIIQYSYIVIKNISLNDCSNAIPHLFIACVYVLIQIKSFKFHATHTVSFWQWSRRYKCPILLFIKLACFGVNFQISIEKNVNCVFKIYIHVRVYAWYVCEIVLVFSSSEFLLI